VAGCRNRAGAISPGTFTGVATRKPAGQRKQVLSIRLLPATVTRIKTVADLRECNDSDLVRGWVRECLEREEAKIAAGMRQVRPVPKTRVRNTREEQK
jgi:hypothetical protein